MEKLENTMVNPRTSWINPGENCRKAMEKHGKKKHRKTLQNPSYRFSERLKRTEEGFEPGTPPPIFAAGGEGGG